MSTGRLSHEELACLSGAPFTMLSAPVFASPIGVRVPFVARHHRHLPARPYKPFGD